MYDDGSNNGNIDYNKKADSSSAANPGESRQNEPNYAHSPYIDPTYTAGNNQGTYSSWNSTSGSGGAQYGGGVHTNNIKAEKPKKKLGWVKVTALCLACLIVGAAAGIGGAELWLNRDTAKDKQIQIGSGAAAPEESKGTDQSSAGQNEQDSAQASGEEGGDTSQNEDKAVSADANPSGGYLVSGVAKSTGTQMSASEVYKKCSPQVVGISLSVSTQNAFGQVTSGTVSGTGFVLTSDGYIATNYHVVETAIQSDSKVTVKMNDGTSYEGKVIGGDADNDVALVKIEAKGLSAATLGNSNEMEVGETVYSIGNPLGELTYTLTSGVVSALDRELQTSVSGSINMFQIDAAINSGNSGGPIYNDRGQVIGIATAKNMTSGVEGIGFAVPVNDAIEVLNELAEFGYVTGKPQIGINTTTISSDFAEYYNMKEGAYVSYVEAGSAADKAGMKEGDIITKIGDKDILSSSDVYSAKNNYKAGDTVKFTVYRNGESVELTLTFDEEKAQTVSSEEQQLPGYGTGESWQEFGR